MGAADLRLFRSFYKIESRPWVGSQHHPFLNDKEFKLGANMALSAKLRVTKLLIKTLETIYWHFVGHHPPAGDKFSFLLGFD